MSAVSSSSHIGVLKSSITRMWGDNAPLSEAEAEVTAYAERLLDSLCPILRQHTGSQRQVLLTLIHRLTRTAAYAPTVQNRLERRSEFCEHMVTLLDAIDGGMVLPQPPGLLQRFDGQAMTASSASA